MTATTFDPGAVTLDISQTPAVPLSRLVRVELRKLVDTRSGKWLMIAIAAITALIIVIFFLTAKQSDRTFLNFMGITATPQGFLLPVMGILLVTSEWTQRTAMVTFTLEPSRSRLILAKFVSTMLIAVVAVVIGLALSVAANLLYGALSGNEILWDIGAVDVVFYFLLHAIGMATGFAFGTLFLNTAAAIVVYFVYSFVLPGLFQLGAQLMDWFADIQPWIDFAAAQNPLIEGSISGEQWAQLAVSGFIWLVLPLAVGLWRVLRAEVK